MQKKRPLKTQAQKGRTPMDAALYYLGIKARGVREMERYLDSQEYGEYEVQQVVERLIELGYLDDAAYADEFIRTRLATKPVSLQKLRDQLLAHELPWDIIEAALSKLPEEREKENAKAIAEKFAAQLSGIPEPEERRQRLMRRLLGRGYSYEDARAAIDGLNGEDA